MNLQERNSYLKLHRCHETFDSFLLERTVHCSNDEQEPNRDGELTVPSKIFLFDHVPGIYQIDFGPLSPSTGSLQRGLLQPDENSVAAMSRARCNQDCSSCETLEQLDEILDLLSVESEDLPFEGPVTVYLERLDSKDHLESQFGTKFNESTVSPPTSLSQYQSLSSEALERSSNTILNKSVLTRTTSSESLFPVVRPNSSSRSVVQSRSVPPTAENTMPQNIQSRISPKSIASLCPTDYDVLCGKGKAQNRNFRHLCRRYAEFYRETTKRRMNGKQGIAMTIVKEIQNNNGRFLKQIECDGNEMWVEIPDTEAAKKVAHCIRDYNRRSCR